jgi:type VI secretion system protein ImpG
VWIELCSESGAPPARDLKRLDVQVLATNRDLPLRVPLPVGEPHLTLEAGGPVSGARVLGTLSRPVASLAAIERDNGEVWGDAAWRLISHLALNYHSLVDGPEDRGADALRGLLELHAAGAEPQIARHADAVRRIASAVVTRRLTGSGPITFARGLEVTLELAEAAITDGSAFLLGSVLEAFFRRYVALNSFTETIVRTGERGEIMRWPAMPGQRQLA